MRRHSFAVPKPAKNSLTERLRALRERHGVTQEDFSGMCGIGYKYYQHIEQGRNVDLRLSTLTKIADAYGIRVDQLLAPTTPKTKLTGPLKRDGGRSVANKTKG